MKKNGGTIKTIKESYSQHENFEDFNRAYAEKGMIADEFESFGASVHTMKTFLEGYDEFTALIRNRMIGK